jgi:polyphosphate kinase 2 (PPK2 family)
MSPHNLADFEVDHDLPRGDYETQLEALQHRLELIQAAYIMQGLKGIVAIEGWDASGKGGLVTRILERSKSDGPVVLKTEEPPMLPNGNPLPEAFMEDLKKSRKALAEA